MLEMWSNGLKIPTLLHVHSSERCWKKFEKYKASSCFFVEGNYEICFLVSGYYYICITIQYIIDIPLDKVVSCYIYDLLVSISHMILIPWSYPKMYTSGLRNGWCWKMGECSSYVNQTTEYNNLQNVADMWKLKPNI